MSDACKYGCADSRHPAALHVVPLLFFFFNDTATTEIYTTYDTLSLHDALPILLIYLYMWFRWTWPRYRYDQLMALGWKWMIPAGLANIVLTAIWYVLALPRPQGVFGLMREQAGRLVPTGKGIAYFIGTAFVLTIPLSWALLATINRRTRDFNLAEQRQLQMRLRRERLEKQLQKGAQESEQAQV